MIGPPVDDDLSSGQLAEIPYRKNPFFRGRGPILTALRSKLTKKKKAALGQAIRGLGGVGKTETAVAYFYKYRKKYQEVFWVRAASEVDLAEGFRAIFQRLWPAQENVTSEKARVAVLRWLSNESGWLLIFDNADKPSILKKYIPIDVKGHVLVTSRANVFSELGLSRDDTIELVSLQPEDALAFFLERTGRENISAEEETTAKKIIEPLDGLPLALEQAASYLAETTATFADYLTSYDSQQQKWLAAGNAQARDYEDSVATTWLVNFQTVQDDHPASADLLRFSAFLHPDEIPYELLTEGASELGDTISAALEGVEDDPLLLHALLEPLDRFSLIRLEKNKTFSIHRLVQQVTQDNLSAADRLLWSERTVRALNVAFPKPDFEHWPTCSRLSPHASAAMKLVQDQGFEFIEAARLANRLARYLEQNGMYQPAEPLYEQALEIKRTALGEDHPDFATSLNNLALLYHSMGRYAEAEPLYKQDLEISRKALGEDHPDFATSLNNLALLYDSMGRYAEAEPLYEQALEIRRSVLGEDHPDFAASLNNLAGLYYSMGRSTEAEPLYEQALEICRSVLGEDHPNFATSLNNLAGLYKSMGRYAEADPLFKQALEIKRKALGEDHPDFAASLNNLAGLYHSMGRSAEAEPLYKQAVEILVRSLGEDHPNTKMGRQNYEMLLREKDR